MSMPTPAGTLRHLGLPQHTLPPPGPYGPINMQQQPPADSQQRAQHHHFAAARVRAVMQANGGYQLSPTEFERAVAWVLFGHAAEVVVPRMQSDALRMQNDAMSAAGTHGGMHLPLNPGPWQAPGGHPPHSVHVYAQGHHAAPQPPDPSDVHWIEPRSSSDHGGALRFYAMPGGGCCYTKDGQPRPLFRRATYVANPQPPLTHPYLEFPEIFKGCLIPADEADRIVESLLLLFEKAGVAHNLSLPPAPLPQQQPAPAPPPLERHALQPPPSPPNRSPQHHREEAPGAPGEWSPDTARQLARGAAAAAAAAAASASAVESPPPLLGQGTLSGAAPWGNAPERSPVRERPAGTGAADAAPRPDATTARPGASTAAPEPMLRLSGPPDDSGSGGQQSSGGGDPQDGELQLPRRGRDASRREAEAAAEADEAEDDGVGRARRKGSRRAQARGEEVDGDPWRDQQTSAFRPEAPGQPSDGERAGVPQDWQRETDEAGWSPWAAGAGREEWRGAAAPGGGGPVALPAPNGKEHTEESEEHDEGGGDSPQRKQRSPTAAAEGGGGRGGGKRRSGKRGNKGSDTGERAASPVGGKQSERERMLTRAAAGDAWWDEDNLWETERRKRNRGSGGAAAAAGGERNGLTHSRDGREETWVGCAVEFYEARRGDLISLGALSGGGIEYWVNRADPRPRLWTLHYTPTDRFLGFPDLGRGSGARLPDLPPREIQRLLEQLADLADSAGVTHNIARGGGAGGVEKPRMRITSAGPAAASEAAGAAPAAESAEGQRRRSRRGGKARSSDAGAAPAAPAPRPAGPDPAPEAKGKGRGRRQQEQQEPPAPAAGDAPKRRRRGGVKSRGAERSGDL
eukprot:TRINITY_DN14730_c0_g1_i1.p1 TRINITY_DN14730_c0_g1~~TRINITY_DN14730_c0_g1_i1.p1  ORF type:complete len:857 (+),score=131.31 TRINITY_DN14730_c0_g1_i1:76-2646(+)